MPPSEEGIIKLVSKEGEVYEVPRNVGLMSTLIKETLCDDDEDDDEADDSDADDKPEIPLPNVSSRVLEKVIEYCKHYQEEEMRPIVTPLKSNKLEDLVQSWYAEFVKVERNLLFAMVAAANFMDIKPLLDLTCLAVSILIKGKSAAELRQMFNLSDEYTAEERAAIARDNNQWIEGTGGGNNNGSGEGGN